jgi:transposase
MGFKFRKTETNRKLLIEKHNICLKRIEYLQKIIEFRRQGRKIVYTDESYVLSSHVVNKSWSSVDDDNTVKQSLSKGKRLIIVHAGGEEGFVPNALLIWEAQSSSGDYHDNMNKDNYYKWVTEKLLPNLSKNSVVVLDNATYHCHQSNRDPNSNSLKKDMINWLTENNISFNSTMLKPQIYDIIRKHKQVFIKYSLDGIGILSKEGHDIIRLPPYHPDLNPIEMIWSQVKQYIAKQNHNGSIKKIAELCKQKMESMGNSEWGAVCANVKKLETEMWKNESYMDIEMDKLIVTYGEDTTDDRDTSTEDEDDDLGVAPLQP